MAGRREGGRRRKELDCGWDVRLKKRKREGQQELGDDEKGGRKKRRRTKDEG